MKEIHGSSYRALIEKHGVWDVIVYKGVEYHFLKAIHHKIAKDIIDAALARFENGEATGKWDLDNIKIRDNIPIVPAAASKDTVQNPAKMLVNLFSQMLGVKGEIPDRMSFLHILKVLSGDHEVEKVKLGLGSLRFHKLLNSAKENMDFVTNAYDHLKNNRFTRERCTWKMLYKDWTKYSPSNILAAQKDEYFKEVLEYRSYENNCVHMLQFLKNLFKHVNDKRVAKGEPVWTDEEIVLRTEYLFPGVMRNFYEFLWFNNVPMDFKKSRPPFPATNDKADASKRATGTVSAMGRVSANGIVAGTNSTYVDFLGFGPMKSEYVPFLEKVCAEHPQIIESQRLNEPRLALNVFTHLGEILHILKTKIRIMTGKSLRLKYLWRMIGKQNIDLGWLEPHVVSALGMKSHLEKARTVKRLREEVEGLVEEQKRQELELVDIDMKLEAARSKLKEEEDGYHEIDEEAEVGYGIP